MSILSIRNIHKSFGALEVLKGIDTDIARGEIVFYYKMKENMNYLYF